MSILVASFHVVLELAKGRIISEQNNHSGEGIFSHQEWLTFFNFF